jgi:Rad3-related DNA helicase
MRFFPYETPRASQEYVLNQVQNNWHKAEVFVIRVPVAGGKSAIATTIQDWCLKQGASAAITVPNNMLRDQYLSEFSWLKTIKAQQDYWLPRFKCTVKEYMKRYKLRYGPKGCGYNEDKKLVTRATTPIVMNFMGYQAHKLFRNVMIVDEAHQLLPVLQNIHARKIWRHVHGYPKIAKSVGEIIMWLESLPQLSGPLAKLKKDISSLTAATTLEFTKDFYRGEEKDCIKLLPMDVSEEPPIFWPPKTKKIILMSATISESDVNNMGLGTRKVHYIDAQSEIPEKQRPILYTPIGSMSKKNRNETMPDLIRNIEEILSQNEGRKGFIHATYELCSMLKSEMSHNMSRLVFHNKENKREQFEKFLQSDPSEGKVFVGAGMAEGIDLKYELGEFQIITKIPFKSLANPCYRYMAVHNPEDYMWITSKDILQASGRICRTPSDYGATYILDKDFDLWYNKARSFGQIPEWFNPRGNV